MKERPLSIIDLINNGTLSLELAAQLWIYAEGMSMRPANLIISGGPGAGKTTLLNAMFSFIPENERLVVIEDTLELNTELEENCSRLESDGEINLRDLVKNSLRMRPERIVIGEVRGPEAQDLMTAMNIGKYCMGTIHASTAREAVIRLENEPMNIPENLINLIDVFIVMKKIHMPNRISRVIEEVTETSGLEQRIVLLSEVYKYDYKQKQTTEKLGSTIYRDRLAQAIGLTPKDIINELKLRANLLEVLQEKQIHKIEDVTKFCRAYNRDAQKAIEGLGLNKEDLTKNL
jgi:flagellar protein FlaI